MLKKLPYILFALLGIIWGSNFIYMKWASIYLTPMQIVFVRVLFGFVPVLFYAYRLHVIKIEHFRYGFHFFMMSLLGTTIYYYFFIKASSLLFSGVTGALSGSIPLFTYLLAMLFLKEEKFNTLRVSGVMIGLFGVVLIANPFDTGMFEANFEGIVSIILGSLILGMSFVYAKKFISPLKIHFAALTTYQLGFALALLFFITDYEGLSSVFSDTHVLLGLTIGLGLLGTGLAYIIYYFLIENLGAVNASSVTYIPPIVALFIGYFLVGEEIILIDIIATGFIFSGVFIINLKKK